MADGAQVEVALIVTDHKDRINAKGDKWRICQVEDLTGRMEVLVFAKAFAELRPLLDADQPLIVTGRVRIDDRDTAEEGRERSVMADSARLLAEVAGSNDAPIAVSVPARRLENGGVDELAELVRRFPGPARLHLVVTFPDCQCRLELGPDFHVSADPVFERAIQEWAARPAPGADTTAEPAATPEPAPEATHG
jgi:DNA polymerase-3 subunit alpha